MSSTLRTLATRRAPFVGLRLARQTMAFRTSAVTMAGKEDALHTEGRAEEIEAEKHDQLQKQKEGKGHWKDSLASNSESMIKADRGEVEASDDTIKELQKEGEKLAGKK
ncbi:hypothetical protein K402DRAFT_395475 [Aulographum hederae CBS 113979]|uniref:Mitochondrial carrier protein pet8 n=1 Tax=Aulographum hederae CBS 113979 TaxID=1176131 RepID=A0A6G1GUZ3_9PEZI|nr:hypothetical protein K402DRAFT_395475 [Aulographum hederae CBS 113979]